MLGTQEELQQILRLLERVDTRLRRHNRLQQLQPHEVQMTHRLAAAFRRQKQLLLRRIGELAEQSVDRWNLDAMWAFVTIQTQGQFTEILQQGVGKGLLAGIAAGSRRLNLPIRVVEQAVGWEVSFSLQNPWAVQYLMEHGAALITGIDAVTRDRIATILRKAAEEGWSYNQVATAISQEFDFMAVGQPMLHIDSRAHLIAVTELGNAYMAAQWHTGTVVEEAGLTVEKYWDTMKDDKVSDGCWANEGAGWIPLRQPFPSGHDMPLRHPGCRCDLLMRVVEATAF